MPSEPLAIVGMGCRFPGAPSLREYWKLLREGIDAIREIPSDRWDFRRYHDADPTKPGKMISKHGGFIDGVDSLDWRSLRISPREARFADPQQRLLLEVAWEAIEDAGIPFERLERRRAGVFIGIMTNDYAKLAARKASAIDGHSMTGNFAFAANRISHTFCLEGPSVALDASCASSLVAVAMACDSIWSGSSDMALVGGVNLILLPDMHIATTKANVLSPDERCKTFDASADGFVRGEGAGIVVLKRLAEARRDRDRIYAVIRASVANHNGKNDWIMATSTEAQVKLLRDAYSRAGIPPSEVDYVELHGTGTQKGDPIEARALGEFLGSQPARDRPCRVGSVKSNIGHLESAAGIASLIKTALALHFGQIPPSLHLKTVNPEIDPSLGIELATKLLPWPAKRERVAGITGLSFGGANAHVVLTADPSIEQLQPGTGDIRGTTLARPGLLLLSARTASSLSKLSKSYQTFLETIAETGKPLLEDVLYTASQRRTHHAFRLAVVGDSAGDLAEKLGRRSGDTPPIQKPVQTDGKPERGVAFVFGGQGAQWPGMGCELFESVSSFRDAYLECDRAFQRRAPWSLVDELFQSGSASRLGETEVAQPMLFAIQVALARTWMALGLRPAVLFGHSVGEIAAAHVAGCFSLEEGMNIARIRSRLMQQATGRGKMIQVALSKEAAESLVRASRGGLSLAADNGPSTVVLSGDGGAIEAVASEMEARGVDARMLPVNYAFHSHQLDGIAAELVSALQGIDVKAPAIPILPTAKARGAAAYEPGYWGEQCRSTVHFREAVEAALKDGVSTFLEISPHPTLRSSVLECAAGAGRSAHVLPSMRRDQGDRSIFLGSVGELFMAGFDFEWASIDRGEGRCVTLPPYAWHRDRCWVTDGGGELPDSSAQPHPFLGPRIAVAPSKRVIFQAALDLRRVPYLREHRIHGLAVFPGAAYLEMVLAACAGAPDSSARLEDVSFLQAMVLPDDRTRLIQLALMPEGSAQGFEVYSQAAHDPSMDWKLHAQGRIAPAPERAALERVDFERLRSSPSVGIDAHYERIRSLGLEYGPSFRVIRELWIPSKGESIARLSLPDPLLEGEAEYRIHPALLDAALHASIPAVTSAFPESDGFLVPIGIERLTAWSWPKSNAWSRTRVRPESRLETPIVDVQLFDRTGQLAVDIRGVSLRHMKRGAIEPAAGTRLRDWLYELVWQLAPAAPEANGRQRPGRWIIFDDRGKLGTSIAERLRLGGDRCHLVRWSAEAQSSAADHDETWIDPRRPDQCEALFRTMLEREGRDKCGVIYLWALDAAGPEHADPLRSGLASVAALHLVQGLEKSEGDFRLWLATRGAQPAGDEIESIAIHQSPLWGFGRVVQKEHPDLECTMVDLPPTSSGVDAIEALVEVLSSERRDEGIALRSEGPYVERLRRYKPRPLVPRAPSFRLSPGKKGTSDSLELPPSPRPAQGVGLDGREAPLFRSDGSYLVTGGLRGLGLETARWLARSGAGAVVVMGRSNPSSEAQASLSALKAGGARIVTLRGDVGSPEDLRRVLAFIAAELPPLRGVFHSAGVLEDGLLLQQHAERFERVLRPKIAGAFWLHELTKALPIDFFVLYSSISSPLGPIGQANYAAGNAFLDALAHERRRRGLAALSINWGPWSEVGLAAARDDLALQGLGKISPADGMHALEGAMREPVAQLMVVSVDRGRWGRIYPSAEEAPLLLELVTEGEATADLDQELAKIAAASASPLSSLTKSALEATPPEERLPAVLKHVAQEIARVAKISAEDVDPQRPILDLGFDSIIAVELRNHLTSSLGVSLTLTSFLVGASPSTIASKILQAFEARQERGKPTSVAGAPPRSERGHPKQSSPFERATADSVPARLSPSEERMWFLDRLHPGTAQYHIHTPLRIEGGLDPDALRRSFAEVIRRHEILRTVFRVEEEHLERIILPTMEIEIPIVVVGELADKTAELRRLSAQQALEPFDLAQGPLLRAMLVDLGREEHALLFTQHHIICDGQSIANLIQELASSYAGFASGAPVKPTPVPLQYAEFAQWQRHQIQGPAFEELRAWWIDRLQGLPSLDLPVDRHPAKRTDRGSVIPFVFRSDVTVSLKELARREQCTLPVAVTAVFSTLLHRYTGQEDFGVGTVALGRNHHDVKDMLGCFVNTLVVRCDLSGDPTFVEQLQRTRERFNAALERQDMPFDRLVQALGVERGSGLTPLLQACVVFESELPACIESGKTRWWLPPVLPMPEAVDSGTARFDLEVIVAEAKGELSGVVQFSTDVFEPETIQRMIGHFEVLLRSAVATPQARLSELAILTEGEARRMLVAWNDTRAEVPEVALHRLFEAQVDSTPSRIAAVCSDQSLTYRELDARAEDLAARLLSLGVGSETRVGIALERSLDAVVAVLGVLKAGAAYVPIDVAHPRERNAFVLEDSGARVLVTHSSLGAPPWTKGVEVVEIDRLASSAVHAHPRRPNVAVQPEQLAYILYTSGSTGKPKGVEVTHGAVVNFIASMQRAPGMGPEETLLAVTTLAFDIAALEIYLPLSVGGRIVAATHDEAQDGSRLLKLLERVKPTLMQATPSTWRMLIAAGWRQSRDLRVISGGEALSCEMADSLLDRASEVWNLFGPTETTVWSTAERIARGDRITIGRPIANTQCFIVDTHGKPVPVGVKGELLIGGRGVARCYHGRPELTREKFVENPFGEGRVYRTGDVARWLSDGRIELLGRRDHQVKIRGHRIELGEIEDALSKHPAVRACAAVHREERLIAYLEPSRPDVTPDLQGFLKERLPAPMLPSVFVWMDRLPLTPNGKIDRKALPATGSPQVEAEVFEAPKPGLEEMIAGVWQELLRIDRVGARDDFFRLGGDSLAATMMMSRIRALCGVDLPLGLLFEAPTVADLANRAEALRLDFSGPASSRGALADGSDPGGRIVTIQRGSRKATVVLVHPLGGNVLCYRELARHMGSDAGVLAIDGSALEAAEPSIPSMASAYVEELGRIVSAGPCLLGGWSFGGLVAYEIAARLAALGRPIPILALLDSHLPTPSRSAAPGEGRTFGLFAKDLVARQRPGLPIPAEYSAPGLGIEERIERTHGWMRRAGVLPTPLTLAELHRLFVVWRAHLTAMLSYVPQDYPGHTVLLRATRATDAWASVFDPFAEGDTPVVGEMGWARHASKLEVGELPGDHYSIMALPNVVATGAALRRLLERLE